MWDLSCVDWEDRIREGRPLIPDLPLFASEAKDAVAFYDEMQLPDVPGTPKLRTASGEWFRDIVRAAFGSWDPVNRVRMIREIFAMAPKGSSKTSYSAALMLVSMLMNYRPRAEALFVGPTQAISDRAYEQAVGMIDESPDLKRRFRPRDHIKTIEDLVTKSEIKVRTFDLKILTGAMGLIFVLLDELHLLGKSIHTAKVLRQIRGGLDKTPEGLLLITTTQSDGIPAGAFKSELKMARAIRDGKYRGRIIRPLLPVLYEFPRDIATLTKEEKVRKETERWKDPANWPMVMPNLGKSSHLDQLIADWQTERDKGDDAIKVWASQHLNIEIGDGISDDGWRGTDYWEAAADETLTLETLLNRSEVVTLGIDGGGLDDLLGLAVIGREKLTRHWLVWCCAWVHPKVLHLRQDIATALADFESEGSLTICKVPEDVAKLAAVVKQVVDSGLLPEKNAVGIDPNNASAVIDALIEAGVTDEMIRRLLQGPALSPAMYGLERKLSDGTLSHADQGLMTWVLGNAKVEMRGNAPMVTKQISGRAKIDPLIALFQAAILMSWNPAGQPDISDFLKNGLMVSG
jgi:phage terminase large subunit-like protein